MTWDEIKRLNPRDIGIWPLPAKFGAVTLLVLLLMGLAAYFGWMPQYEDIDWSGMDFPREQFDTLQHFDRAAWRNEVLGHEELFIDLHDHLPKEMVYERELLICRL